MGCSRWKCQNAPCTTWMYSDKTTLCTECGASRLQEPQEKKATEVYKLGKEYDETISRLLAEASENPYQLPAGALENNSRRKELEDNIVSLTRFGCSSGAKEAREMFAKLPKRVEKELQPRVDMTTLTQLKFNLKKYHTKMD